MKRTPPSNSTDEFYSINITEQHRARNETCLCILAFLKLSPTLKTLPCKPHISETTLITLNSSDFDK